MRLGKSRARTSLAGRKGFWQFWGMRASGDCLGRAESLPSFWSSCRPASYLGQNPSAPSAPLSAAFGFFSNSPKKNCEARGGG